MKKLIFILITTFAQSFAIYANDKINDAILVARGGQASSYKLNIYEFPINIVPSINDKRKVSFRFKYHNGNTGKNYYEGIWAGSINDGKAIYNGSKGNYISDPSLNSNGELIFSEFSVDISRGVYYWNFKNKELKTIIYPGGPFLIKYFKDLQINDHSQIFFRGKTFDRTQFYYGPAPMPMMGVLKLKYNVLEEGGDFSYLFTPQANNQKAIAFVARMGLDGDIHRFAPDRILILKGTKLKVVAEDIDSQFSSPYREFANGLDINDHGDVVFKAILENKQQGLYLYNNQTGKISEIAKSGKDLPIIDIQNFSPKINNHRDILFRGIDQKGNYHLYYYSHINNKIRSLIQNDSLVQTDLGLKRPSYGDGKDPFFGGVNLNNHGDVIFTTSLSEIGKYRRVGVGVFVIKGTKK